MQDLRSRIQALQTDSRILEPSSESIRACCDRVKEFSLRFLDGLPEGPAFRVPSPGSRTTFAPDGQAHDLAQLLDQYDRGVLQEGLNPASGGHLGYIPGGGVFPGALGDFLAAVTNPYAGMYFAGPGAVRLEHDLIRWMCQMIGYPVDALGNLTSGGSIANLIAFVAARDAQGVTSERVRKSVIYLTEQVHHCVHKAIRIGGLAEAMIRRVPMDARFRMDAARLGDQIAADKKQGLYPFLVVASAGTTDTGSVDPLAAIADICQHHAMWFHVDAAYGGFFLLTGVTDPEGLTVRARFEGIARSHSVAIDPHKGLFLSYGLGALLIRDVATLFPSHHYRASYMQDTLAATDEFNPADLSPELTKHFRGLRMWLPLQLLGVGPFRAALEEKILLCRYFYAEVQRLGFEVGPFPELSVCIFRWVPNQGDANSVNLELVEAIHRDGHVFVSSTTIQGVVWLRLAVLCFRTHQEHIDYLLNFLCARKLKS